MYKTWSHVTYVANQVFTEFHERTIVFFTFRINSLYYWVDSCFLIVLLYSLIHFLSNKCTVQWFAFLKLHILDLEEKNTENILVMQFWLKNEPTYCAEWLYKTLDNY